MAIGYVGVGKGGGAKGLLSVVNDLATCTSSRCSPLGDSSDGHRRCNVDPHLRPRRRDRSLVRHECHGCCGCSDTRVGDPAPFAGTEGANVNVILNVGATLIVSVNVTVNVAANETVIASVNGGGGREAVGTESVT